MDEKLNKEEQEQTVAKKVYTSPTLTVYGKLSDLTAAGTGTKSEGAGTSDNKNRQKP